MSPWGQNHTCWAPLGWRKGYRWAANLFLLHVAFLTYLTWGIVQGTYMFFYWNVSRSYVVTSLRKYLKVNVQSSRLSLLSRICGSTGSCHEVKAAWSIVPGGVALGNLLVHVCAQSLSHVWLWLFVYPWTVAGQALLFMEFSSQEYWSGLLVPTPGGIFLTEGSNPRILCLLHWLADSLPLCHLGALSVPWKTLNKWHINLCTAPYSK